MHNSASKSNIDLDLDIVIPVYNEATNIIQVLEQFKLNIKANYRILICYDFPEDNTLIAIQNYNTQNLNIKFILNQSTGPLGAIISGFQASTAPYVLVYPADDFINTLLIDHMLYLAKCGADIVCPSRFMPGGYMKNCPKIKSVIMQCVNFLLYYIAQVPTRDSSNGFRLFSKKVLNNIDIESTQGFAYSIELLVKAHRLNYNIKEIPSTWIERTNGQSRFKVFGWFSCYMRWFVYAFATMLYSLKLK